MIRWWKRTVKDEEKIMEHILGELRLNGLVSLEREAYEQMDVGLQGKSERHSPDIEQRRKCQQAGNFRCRSGGFYGADNFC